MSSCYSEQCIIYNVQIVYFWNFPFNIFCLQLTMGKLAKARIEWRGTTELPLFWCAALLCQHTTTGGRSGRHRQTLQGGSPAPAKVLLSSGGYLGSTEAHPSVQLTSAESGPSAT